MGMWLQDGCVGNRIRSGTEKRERNKRSDTLLAQLVKGVHQRPGEGDEFVVPIAGVASSLPFSSSFLFEASLYERKVVAREPSETRPRRGSQVRAPARSRLRYLKVSVGQVGLMNQPALPR